MKEKEPQKEKETVAERKSPCEVTFFVGDQSFKGTSMHFSERGMLILCRSPAPLNARVRMLLQFPGLKHSIELNGDVVWTNIHGAGDSLAPKGMGLKFAGIDRDMERLLAELAGQYECFGSIYSCYFS